MSERNVQRKPGTARGSPRQPEEKVHAVCLAPSHQLLPRETAVGAHQNAHKWRSCCTRANAVSHKC